MSGGGLRSPRHVSRTLPDDRTPTVVTSNLTRLLRGDGFLRGAATFFHWDSTARHGSCRSVSLGRANSSAEHRRAATPNRPRHRVHLGGSTAFALRVDLSQHVVQKPSSHWDKPSGGEVFSCRSPYAAIHTAHRLAIHTANRYAANAATYASTVMYVNVNSDQPQLFVSLRMTISVETH